jgi:hypothetical protein
LQARDKAALARLFALRLAWGKWRLAGAVRMAEWGGRMAEQNQWRLAEVVARTELVDWRTKRSGQHVGAGLRWAMTGGLRISRRPSRVVVLRADLCCLHLTARQCRCQQNMQPGEAVSQTERLYRLKHLFDSGRCLGKVQLMAELGGVSFATLKLDIEHLRVRMNAPVVFDRQEGGYQRGSDDLPGALSYRRFPASGSVHCQQRIEIPVAKLILQGKFGPKDVIPVDVDEAGEFRFGRTVH